MADDLEAFLRQVAQRRAGTGQPARKQPASKPGPAGGQAANKPSASQSSASEEEIVEAETVAPDRIPLRRDTGNREKNQRFQGGTGHANRKRGEAEWDEDQVEAHVHQTFDHHVGALDSGPGMPKPRVPTSEDAPAPAAEIARLLANPQALKNAIVLSEILSPPHIRW